MNNQVDIIIPVYNSQKYISKTIKSVLRQSFKNWKLIVIDDASTDRTLEILKKINKKKKIKQKIIILKNKINMGQAFSRNKGLQHSRAKFVAFLDSDDFWHKNKLKKQIKFMLSNNYDFTYTDYKIIKNNQIQKITVPDSYSYQRFIYNTSIGTSTMVLKKKIIKNIYFKNLRLSEDYFFKCQILKRGYSAYKCPGFYTNYLIRKGSLQSYRLFVFFSLWNINKNLNKMYFLQNLTSIFFITINSLKKYGFR